MVTNPLIPTTFRRVQLFVLAVTFIGIPGITHANVPIAWTDLASTNREFKVELVTVADGDTTATTIGGLQSRRNANPANDFYMYFAVADDFAFQGNRPNLFITVHYWDGPASTFSIQYDSAASAYLAGPQISTTGSNTWKTHTLGVKNAYFGNRQNGGADFRVAATPGATFYLDLAYVREILPRFPSIMFNPTYYHAGSGTLPTSFLQVCLNPGQWLSGESQTDFFGSVDWQLANGNASQLSTCFNNLRNLGKRFTVEVPALKDWCQSAQHCYNDTWPKLQGFINQGAQLDTIALDEPLNAAVNLFGSTSNYAVAETAKYMKLMRDRFPYTQIMSIEPHPTFTASDLSWWVTNLNAECAKIGTMIMDVMIVDHDYNDPAGNVGSMAGLKTTVNNLGPRFGVAFFGSTATSNAAFHQKVMAQGQAYSSVLLDLYWVTSWDPYPNVQLPESTSNTFTYTLIQFVWNHVWGR